ncbi:hypothetical protein DESA109040_17625 [Deinococcus saxicola]
MVGEIGEAGTWNILPVSSTQNIPEFLNSPLIRALSDSGTQ